MKLNWNFLGGKGVQNKKSSVEGVWIFSGAVHISVSGISHLQHLLIELPAFEAQQRLPF